MTEVSWHEQLRRIDVEIEEGKIKIAAALASIKPIQDRQAHLEAVRSAIRSLIDFESGKPSDAPPPIELKDLLGYESKNFLIKAVSGRQRSVNSPRQVMLRTLKEAGRPMSPAELWDAAAAAGHTTKQDPADAANYSMYGAKSKHGDPVERLPTGQWVWRGA